ncbi:MAG TPA: hypothetical protein DF282_23360, partial [Hyphomonas sp.]|nr:hypothetical protein [Hyphomonas sp.]
DFIVRSPALDDRRAYTLDLTPAANALVLSLDATAQELKDDLLHSLSEQEISSLNRGLNKLKSNLQRLSATAISVFPLRPDTCAELQTTLCSVPLL